MSAQPEDQQMEGVQDPTTESKGKGKAPEAVEESMDDDSSDESGAEDQVCSAFSSLCSSAQIANSSALGWRR